MTDVLLSASALEHAYGSTPVLRGAGLTVRPGEVVALTGPSGSGKSTLLYCLSGIVSPDSGTVEFRGEPLLSASSRRRAAIRRAHFGFVFQFAELVPELTVAENVSLPLEINGVGRAERRERVAAILAQLEIEPQAGQRPSQISGGQAQRAAVARALVHRPDVVFADEPTGSLDTRNASVVLAALLGMARTQGTAVILVTHDKTVAAEADRQIEVRDGVTEASRQAAC